MAGKGFICFRGRYELWELVFSGVSSISKADENALLELASDVAEVRNDDENNELSDVVCSGVSSISKGEENVLPEVASDVTGVRIDEENNELSDVVSFGNQEFQKWIKHYLNWHLVLRIITMKMT